MSFAVTMVNSSQGMSPSKEMFLMRPRAHWAAHGHAVKHFWESQIVDVQRRAGDFLAAFFARRRLTNDMFVFVAAHLNAITIQSPWLFSKTQSCDAGGS